MVRKLFWIIVFVFVFFLIEHALFYFFGFWFKPNLILLLIIFLNLTLGIRYGLAASFAGGILKDSFSSGAFGGYLLGFVLCSYVLVLIRKYFFHLEVLWFRLALGSILAVLNVLIVFIVNSFFAEINFREVFIFVLLPEVFSTTLVASFLFDYLRKCALKLFV